MRLRKKVLLYTQNESVADQLKFMLELRGYYRVTHMANAKDVLDCCASGYFLLIAEMELHNDASKLAKQAKILCPQLPVMLFSRSVNSYEWASHADYFIPEIMCNSETILYWVRVLTARKRGPKPRGVAALHFHNPSTAG